jgi:hypothetical protein
MNFLEQLVAEWYEYQGYFATTNIKFGKLSHGGWAGEMDVVAFDPESKEIVHIETSSDADSWEKREIRIKKKFGNASKHYKEKFPFTELPIKQIAIVGYGKPKKKAFDEGIEVESISGFVKKICEDLKKIHPLKEVVSEQYPLLRAIQFAVNAKTD